MDDTRQRLNEEKEDKARKTKEEADSLSKELRYTQQVVAGELAGWQDLHQKLGRKAVKDLAKAMLIQEKTRLEGMKRALRKLHVVPITSWNTSADVVKDEDVSDTVIVDVGEGSVHELRET